IAQSWHTDEIRKQRPSPVDEAKWGFAVVENSLWQGVPNYLRDKHWLFYFGKRCDLLDKLFLRSVNSFEWEFVG
ncbi:phosphoenolpyruvate carboxylase, partial [Salmonella enterica subsp. enterica serovar Cerro]|nr:phosphoenolpyruvate carboxylase [Salmonella enterica subsp. enterica serovar Cerro]